MKNSSFILILTLIVFGIFVSCNNNTSVVNNPATADGTGNSGSLPVLSLEFDEFDFGKVIQGEKVSIPFKFKNTGGSALVIATANAGCGCTVPNYPKTPINPGEEGVIEVSFNSSGKRGSQNQKVSLTANTSPTTTVLTIKANVVSPEN